MKTYVAGFMFRLNSSQVCLVRKRKGGQFQVGKLNGIGGKIEGDELPVVAMVREFLEETDCLTSVADWRQFCILGDGKTWQVHFFIYPDGGRLNPKTTEEEEIGWYPWPIPMPNGHMQCVHNLQWLIPMALDKDKVFASVTDTSTF